MMKPAALRKDNPAPSIPLRFSTRKTENDFLRNGPAMSTLTELIAQDGPPIGGPEPFGLNSPHASSQQKPMSASRPGGAIPAEIEIATALSRIAPQLTAAPACAITVNPGLYRHHRTLALPALSSRTPSTLEWVVERLKNGSFV